MFLRDGLFIGARHHLFVGECDTVELVREFGTPLYVLDEQYLRQQCRKFRSAMQRYASGGVVSYASKAFSNVAVCRILDEEQMSLDVVSAGELYTARKAGFPMERVSLHGNCKTPEEIRMAVEWDVGHIILDNLSEIPLIQETAARCGKVVSVMIRLNPGIDTHTHSAVQTARTDCKFGLGIDDGEALAAVKQVAMCPNLHLTGVHTHLGSQIFDVTPYLMAIERLTDFMLLSSVVTGKELTELNLGGGFGVRYTPEDPPTPDIDEWLKKISVFLERQSARKGLRVPKLFIEPGRSLIAEAGVALYTVGAIKEIPDIRTYVSVDGGMADNPRVALYGARYQALLANRAGERASHQIALAGRACESGDVLGYDFMLPYPEIGDVVAILTAGAYHMSMASHYNRVSTPAVVLARYGKAELISKRQTMDELTQYDVLPGRLMKG